MLLLLRRDEAHAEEEGVAGAAALAGRSMRQMTAGIHSSKEACDGGA